jgi:hypothetical protein
MVKKSEAPKPKRSFRVTVTCQVDLELTQDVIDTVDDAWRGKFHDDVMTPEDVAAFIGSTFARGTHSIAYVDGFAHLPNDAVDMVNLSWEAVAKEVT